MKHQNLSGIIDARWNAKSMWPARWTEFDKRLSIFLMRWSSVVGPHSGEMLVLEVPDGPLFFERMLLAKAIAISLEGQDLSYMGLSRMRVFTGGGRVVRNRALTLSAGVTHPEFLVVKEGDVPVLCLEIGRRGSLLARDFLMEHTSSKWESLLCANLFNQSLETLCN